MWKSYRKKRSYAKKSKASYRKKRTARLAKPVRRAVKKIVNSLAETKQVVWSGNFNTCSYTSNNSSAGFVPLTPHNTTPGLTLTQGTGEGNRIGNTVRVVKATMRYCVYANPYDGLLNLIPKPQDLIIRLFTGKRSTTTLLTSVPGYFELGSSSITPTGTVADLNRQVNNDLYSEYTVRKHKVGFSNYGGTGNQTNYQSYANNDYKLNIVKTIDYTKYIPKVIRFDDSLSENPTSKLVQMFVESVNADGTTQPSSYTPLSFNYTLSLWYKDS